MERRQTLAASALAGACLWMDLPGVACLGLGVLAACALGPWARGGAAGTWLLKASVVLLAAGTDFGEVLSVGRDGLGTAFLTILIAGGSAWILGRRLGLPRDVILLIGAGTAICGGSAIAAAAPALRARGEDVGVALAVVFVLNAAALLVFPALGHSAGLDAIEYGRLCALAIHDTSSVVSAAADWGPDSLRIATITKLARALWIVPVAFCLSVCSKPGETRRRVHIPGFLVLFLAVSLLVELVPALRPAGVELAELGAAGLRIALLAMGLGLSARTLRVLGWRPLALGLGVWTLLTAVSLLLC